MIFHRKSYGDVLKNQWKRQVSPLLLSRCRKNPELRPIIVNFSENHVLGQVLCCFHNFLGFHDPGPHGTRWLQTFLQPRANPRHGKKGNTFMFPIKHPEAAWNFFARHVAGRFRTDFPIRHGLLCHIAPNPRETLLKWIDFRSENRDSNFLPKF